MRKLLLGLIRIYIMQSPVAHSSGNDEVMIADTLGSLSHLASAKLIVQKEKGGRCSARWPPFSAEKQLICNRVHDQVDDIEWQSRGPSLG